MSPPPGSAQLGLGPRRYLDRALRQAFYPNDQQIVAEAEKLPHGGAPETAYRLRRLSSAPPRGPVIEPVAAGSKSAAPRPATAGADANV